MWEVGGKWRQGTLYVNGSSVKLQAYPKAQLPKHWVTAPGSSSFSFMTYIPRNLHTTFVTGLPGLADPIGILTRIGRSTFWIVPETWVRIVLMVLCSYLIFGYLETQGERSQQSKETRPETYTEAAPAKRGTPQIDQVQTPTYLIGTMTGPGMFLYSKGA